MARNCEYHSMDRWNGANVCAKISEGVIRLYCEITEGDFKERTLIKYKKPIDEAMPMGGVQMQSRISNGKRIEYFTMHLPGQESDCTLAAKVGHLKDTVGIIMGIYSSRLMERNMLGLDALLQYAEADAIACKGSKL